MRTSLRNTTHIIVTAAVLHNLVLAYGVPELDDIPEDPDNPRPQEQPCTVKNIQGTFMRRQIISDYFA